MSQIRYGLEQFLNVSIYANPNIEWEQMLKIRLELESNK